MSDQPGSSSSFAIGNLGGDDLDSFTATDATTIDCPHCQAPNAPDAVICAACSQLMSEAPTPEPAAPDHARRNKIIGLSAIGIVVVIVLSLCGWFTTQFWSYVVAPAINNTTGTQIETVNSGDYVTVKFPDGCSDGQVEVPAPDVAPGETLTENYGTGVCQVTVIYHGIEAPTQSP